MAQDHRLPVSKKEYTKGYTDGENTQKARRKITVTGRFFDYTLLFVILLLLGFGLIMIYSVSSYEALDTFGDAAYYVKSQARSVIIGLILMIIFAQIPHEFWKRVSLPFYLLVLILNVCVFIPGIGTDLNTGSNRWISVGSLSFQPSEFVKISVILLLATLLSRLPVQIRRLRSFAVIIGVLLPIVVVVALSNLSTAIIIAGIAFIMLFVINAQRKHLAALLCVGVIFGLVFIMIFGYRSDRVAAWLNPESASTDTYQTVQGLYAIGSGGFFGKGLGASLQKLENVPEAQNDFIFTIIVEELGFFGAVCVLILFALMLWRFVIIAVNARDLYGSLLVVGVMAHIALQVILNIAVVTNTIPNTGITLPFISYGGTSVMILLAEMGIVLNVSRAIPLHLGDANREG